MYLGILVSQQLELGVRHLRAEIRRAVVKQQQMNLKAVDFLLTTRWRYVMVIS
jgi:hypothetical protein